MLRFRDKAALWPALALVVGLQTVWGCLPPDGNAPPIDIRVRQIDGQVSFESILRDKIFFIIPHPVSLRVRELTVRDSQRKAIWTIYSSADPHAAGQEIQYGVVPEGYGQRVPKEGRAPGLKMNAEYEVEVSWGVVSGRVAFIYKGSK